jgi:hypothetical protein
LGSSADNWTEETDNITLDVNWARQYIWDQRNTDLKMMQCNLDRLCTENKFQLFSYMFDALSPVGIAICNAG